MSPSVDRKDEGRLGMQTNQLNKDNGVGRDE
jgi:hypothetical protein